MLSFVRRYQERWNQSEGLQMRRPRGGRNHPSIFSSCGFKDVHTNGNESAAKAGRRVLQSETERAELSGSPWPKWEPPAVAGVSGALTGIQHWFAVSRDRCQRPRTGDSAVTVTQPSEGGPAREPLGDTVGKEGVQVLLAKGVSLLRWQNHHVLQ